MEINAVCPKSDVISELIRPKPAPKVTSWIDSTDEELLFLSVLTLEEIRKGVVQLSRSARRTALEAWLRNDLPLRFSGRIVNIDQHIADRWGYLSSSLSAKGAPVAVIDGLLAATAAQHDLTLVTRNMKDIAATGVPLFNPWTENHPARRV